MSNFRKAVSENGQYRFDFAAPSTDISITPFGIIVYGKAAEANAAVCMSLRRILHGWS